MYKNVFCLKEYLSSTKSSTDDDKAQASIIKSGGKVQYIRR